MFLLGNATGNENAEMANTLVNSVDDGLTVGPDFVDVGIEIEDSIQCLLRRSNIVSLGAEHHDG